LPPFVIYKSKSVKPEWTSWEGARYSCSDSGWMKAKNFVFWLDEVFCPYARDCAPEDYNGPLFLILDGHTSHLSIDAIKTARGNNVVLIRLPSHSTHILQVLDVSFFGPAKNHWSNIIKNFMRDQNKKVIICCFNFLISFNSFCVFTCSQTKRNFLVC
jgi:hypothetical protein